MGAGSPPPPHTHTFGIFKFWYAGVVVSAEILKGLQFEMRKISVYLYTLCGGFRRNSQGM